MTQRTLTNKTEDFIWLLRNKMNIGRSKRKKTERGNHRIWPSRAEIFGWLIRNEMNKTDIDGVKTKVLIQPCQRWGEPKGLPADVPTLRSSQKSALFTHLEKFKSRKAEITMRNLMQINHIKDDRRARVLWLYPSLRTQRLSHRSR